MGPHFHFVNGLPGFFSGNRRHAFASLQFHHDLRSAFVRADVVDRHEVRVVQRPGGPARSDPRFQAPQRAGWS